MYVTSCDVAVKILTELPRSSGKQLIKRIIGAQKNKISLPGIINILKRTGYVMHQQFNIQQLYSLPTLYLCVLYLSENKQRLVPLTA